MSEASFHPETTMIGSLPHREPREAIALLNRYPLSIPAWPQLPKRSFLEDMCVQYGENLPAVRIDTENRRIWVDPEDNLPDALAEFYEKALAEDPAPFAVADSHAAGLHAFIKDLSVRGSKLPSVKGQVVGPVTAGLSIADRNGRPLWFNEQYRDVLVRNMCRTALWMAKTLGRFADRTIIFLDEPIFSALGTPAYMGIGDEDVLSCYGDILQDLHAAGVVCGIHCCGNMDWSLLLRTTIDIISFDAYSYAYRVALYAGGIGSFLERGGRLAWGIVPTASPELVAGESVGTLEARINDGIALFASKGISGDLLRRSMILTPSCGMGPLPVDAAERVLSLLGGLGAKMRQMG